VLESARELAGDVRARAGRIEADGRLPEELVDRLAAAGLFRLAVPASLGGAETDPVTLCEVAEEIGRADGSTGWCVMIAAATGVALGRLDEPVAAGLLDVPRFLLAGVAAPLGTATPADGGVRVSGRWPFASAGLHASWLVAGCVTADGVRHVVVPVAEVTIHPTWDVAGLRGTGSHDMELRDVFVPGGRTFSLAGPAVNPAPLYAFPVLGLLAVGIGAVALGIGRAAVDELVALAGSKPVPGGGTVAGRPSVQRAVAEAEAALGGGRGFLHAAVRDAWRTVVAGDPVTLTQRARLRLAVIHATESAARAVDLAYRSGGGSSVYASSPLQRHFRDVHVATQHAMVGPEVTALAGAALLGHPTDTSRL
jgi:indole-3-acetate monooxygenase